MNRPALLETLADRIAAVVCPHPLRVAIDGVDGGSADVHAPENLRYVEGRGLYLRECEPARLATIVIRNEDLTPPQLLI